MSKVLKELAAIVNKAEEREEGIEDALREAAYQLQARQFLYRSKGRHKRFYELIIQHQNYYITLMDALNFDLVIMEDRGYAGILPRTFARRMSLDSTLLLFTLRFIYDQELTAFNAEDNGTVQVTLEDFETRCKQLTRRDIARSEADLKKQLEVFTRIGIAEVGPDDDMPEITRVKINPSITALLTGDMLKRVEVYLRAEDIETQPTANDDRGEGTDAQGGTQ